MAKTAYHHLRYDDRCTIEILCKEGKGSSYIAQKLGCHRSTISREIKRNKGKRGYRYQQANVFALMRRASASGIKHKMKEATLEIVLEKLTLYQWSPIQIAGWLKANKKESVSHESIYQYIWKDKKQGGSLYKHLRHTGKKYSKRKGQNAGRGLIPNRVGIENRPTIVDEKVRVGDWEVDTIIGNKHKGAIVSIVDRVSKYVKLELVKSKHADGVAQAIIKSLAPLADEVHTITADNGKEFAQHENIASELNAKVYFARPYHSWERGLNEHTNGLVRQYFSKNISFDTLSKEDVQEVENLLNSRPRKILNFLTPLEAFRRAQINYQFVALQN